MINFDEFVRGASMLGIKGTNRSLNELFPNLCTTVDGVIHQDASLLDAVQLMGKMPPPLIEESSALSGIEFQFSVAVVELATINLFISFIYLWKLSKNQMIHFLFYLLNIKSTV